jgi:hypothetical protein
VVLWNDNPTSVYAKPEKTIVDGKVLFDIDEDKKMREEIRKDKARIMQKMIAEKQGGAPTQKPRMRQPKLWDCEDFSVDDDYLNDEE